MTIRAEALDAGDQRPIVALLASPATSPLVLYGLYDVLVSLGAVYPDMVSGIAGAPLLDVRIVAGDVAPFRCLAGNIPVEPHASLATIGPVDVAIVCDMYMPIDTPPKGRYPAEIAWLRDVHARGTLVCSVCSGSLILAEAGLLDGRRCAGHWAYRDLFRSAYPRVDFAMDSILNLESEAEGIVTAASVTAWQDLALYVIARLCGNEQALRTAKVYLLSGHEDGQLPFAMMGRQLQKDDGAIAPLPAVDRRQLRRRQSGRRHGRAGRAQPANLQPPLPRSYWLSAARICAPAADRGGQAADRAQRRPSRRGGLHGGLRGSGVLPRLFKRQTGLTPAAYRRKFAPIMNLAAADPRQRQ